MTAVIHTYCNPYGAETGGAKRYLGDTDAGSKVYHQWHCDNPATGRYKLHCHHGHTGPVMHLCDQHANAFRNRDMTFCPACNTKDDHKCSVDLIEIS